MSSTRTWGATLSLIWQPERSYKILGFLNRKNQLKIKLTDALIEKEIEIVLWPLKGSLMKTQTRILDNRLYYTRKIELHRKGKKSRTVRITPILICGIWCSPHLTGMCGTRAFFRWVRAQGHSPHAPGISQKCLRHRRHSHYYKSPGTEIHSTRSVPLITRPAEVLPGTWRGIQRYWSAFQAAKSLSTNNGEKSPLWWDG